MFSYRDSRGPVEVAFTDRADGVSEGDFASLNLAAHGEDDPQTVLENLRLVVGAFAGEPEAPVAVMDQVHGADVLVIDQVPPPLATPLGAGHQVDALVTALPGVALVVRVADCVPILLADTEAGVVGAVHAGRPGLVAGVVPAAVAAMETLGARRLVAWVGPHVCGSCYEVPAAMRDAVVAAVPQAWSETSWGTPAVDVGAGVRAQLEAAGAEILDAARCTLEHPDLYSYRRDGARAGRMAGLVRVRP